MWIFSIAHQHRMLLVWTRRSNISGLGSYHVSAPLLERSINPVVKRQHKPAGSERSAQRKAWKNEMPVLQMPNQRKGIDNQRKGIDNQRKGIDNQRKGIDNQRKGADSSKVSSELRRLSLEDLPEEKERLQGQRSTLDSSAESDEVVFGVSPCLLALTQGRRKAKKLFVKEGEASHRASVLQVCEAAHRRGVQIQRVSKRELDKMSSVSVHQGVCLQASPLSYLTEDRDSAPSRGDRDAPLWLVLERIQDPMNLGAILRSAYFLGVDRVASSLRHSCPLSPVVSKASSGVMEVMDVYGYDNLGHMLKMKLAQGWQVVGTVGAGAEVPVTPCADFQMTKPTLLLMGGEGGGLSQQLLSLCQTFLTIPAGRELVPGVESLNVSVATGILLHALLSSRRPTR